jgi:hypothetical protein
VKLMAMVCFTTIKTKKVLHTVGRILTLKCLSAKYSFLGSLNDQIGYTIFEHHANENKLIIQKDCKGLIAKDEFLILLDICEANSYEWLCAFKIILRHNI